MSATKAVSKFIRSLFAATPKVAAKPAPVKQKYVMAPEKRVELQKLCEQLFKKKALITSGKLQFIGLEAVRKRLGKQWDGMATIVYEITEDVMREHLPKGDFFFRYKDDSYVLIMAQANMIEGRIRAAAIAEAIRERLFALDEDDLKNLEIQEAVRQLKANFSTFNGTTDFLDELTAQWDAEDSAATTEEETAEDLQEDVAISATEVDTSSYSIRPMTARTYNFSELRNYYEPLWDVPHNALTTYLCLLTHRDETNEDTPLTTHMSFYEKQGRARAVDLDLFVLRTVMSELERMASDGRKFLIACPVHYDTLYNYESFEQYKYALSRFPEPHKAFLNFYVMGVPEALPAKDPLWFSHPIQQYARQTIFELPLHQNINFALLRTAGIKAVSVNIEAEPGDEQNLLKALNIFASRANGYHMKIVGVIGVSTLSVTTSAVCAGFKLLGGRAIHGMVETPDNVHRYRHEDLLKGLTATSPETAG